MTGRRLIGIAMVLAVAAGTLSAHASTPNATVNGCFDDATGQLRVIVPGDDTCEVGKESPLSWNGLQLSTRWYRDFDGDGYGDWYRFVESPAQPGGYVENNLDCNDNKATVNPDVKPDTGPGDRNCNGREAEDRVITWSRDVDGDGWGGAATVSAPMSAQPKGYVHRPGDCNDKVASIHPYQTKCHADGDLDSDGHIAISMGGDDCNDVDANDFPGNHESTDPWGHDEDCDRATGYVIPYDPNFLDPRPHNTGAAAYSQSYFDTNGHLVVDTTPGGVDLCASPMSAPAAYCPGDWYTPPLYP